MRSGYIVIILVLICTIYIGVEFWDSKPKIALIMGLLCVTIIYREVTTLRRNK